MGRWGGSRAAFNAGHSRKQRQCYDTTNPHIYVRASTNLPSPFFPGFFLICFFFSFFSSHARFLHPNQRPRNTLPPVNRFDPCPIHPVQSRPIVRQTHQVYMTTQHTHCPPFFRPSLSFPCSFSCRDSGCNGLCPTFGLGIGPTGGVGALCIFGIVL